MSEYLAVRKVPVTACVATEYGETLLTETEYLKVHAGRMDEAAMGQFFEEQKTELVVDATHPYAAVVSENVAAACKKAGVEYLRLIRESSTSETEDAVLRSKHLSYLKWVVLLNMGTSCRLLIWPMVLLH